MTGRDLFLTLLIVIIWGVSFSVIKVGLEELPPILFVALRFLAVALPAVFFTPVPKTSFWNVIAVGLFIGVIKFGLLFVAMREDAGAGMSSLVLQAQVFFTIGLSWIIFREALSRRQLAGIVLAAFGFSFFIIEAGGSITYTGLALVLGAAFAWALSNIVMKRMRTVNLLHFMVWVSLVPPAPLFLFSLAFETPAPFARLASLSPGAWLSVAYMAYLSTLVAYAVWGGLLKRNAAARVTPFALLIPIVGLGVAGAFLGERMTMLEIIGAGAVVAGLCLCSLPVGEVARRLGLRFAARKTL